MGLIGNANSPVGVPNGPFAQAPTYTVQTLSCGAFTAANVDTQNSKASGFQWYTFNFFGQAAGASTIVLPGDGSIQVGSTIANGYNANLASCVSTGGSAYKGTAFGGGGYFEATLSFNAANLNPVSGFPAWWTMAIEHLASPGVADVWPGQAANYENWIELDIFEAYNLTPNYYATLHNGYGIAGSYSDVPLTNTTPVFAPGSKHAYGMLWVPATSSTQGYVQFFMDRQAIGARTLWNQQALSGVSPPPVSPWEFGVVDGQHLCLILGAGPSTPMSVYSVNVWQPSSASNLVF